MFHTHFYSVSSLGLSTLSKIFFKPTSFHAFNFLNLLLSQILQWRTFSLLCIFYQQMYLPVLKKTNKISPCDITNDVVIQNISEYDHTFMYS